MADPPPLLAIPVEMQLAICRQLVKCYSESSNSEAPVYLIWQDALENFAALGSLSRTCKSLQHVVNPLVYERVKVSVYRPRSFMRLIKHFSQFSNRAALVKELRIGTSMVPNAYMFTEFALSAAPVNFLIREANCLGLQLPPGGVDLCETFESLLIDVVLCQLPAIRKVVVSLPWTMAVPHEGLTESNFNKISNDDLASEIIPLQYATRLPKAFVLSSLRHLEALLPKGPQPTFLSRLHKESLTTLLRHAPGLAHLRVGLCEEQQVRGIIQDVLPELKAIHLDGASNSDLAAITRFCPKLERCRLAVGVCKEYEWALQFVMQTGMSLSPDTRPSPGTDHFFLRLLLPLRSTLRELTSSGTNLVPPKSSISRRYPISEPFGRCVWCSGSGPMATILHSSTVSQPASSHFASGAAKSQSTILPFCFANVFEKGGF